MVIKDAGVSSNLLPVMGKSLTYDDLKKIIAILQLELADYRKIEAVAQAVFNQFKQVAERLQSGIYRYDIKSHRFLFFNRLIIEMLGSKESKAADITSASVFLRIHIADDGNGFVKEQPSTGNIYRAGLGMTAMEERARMLDGTMRVYSIIGIGTRLAFMIPIEKKGTSDEFLSFSIG